MKAVKTSKTKVRTPFLIERVRSFVLSDRQMTVRMIADVLNMDRFSVHTILIDHLGLEK